MEQKMKQRIEVNGELRAKLAETFNVTPQFVSQSLNFKRNSKTAFAIRESALVNGGKLQQIIDVTENRTIKVLDQKGNITKLINQ